MVRMRFNALQCLFGISREATYAAEFVFKFFYEADIAAPVWCVIKPLVFRSRNGYMLVCWISLICSKKGIFSRLFVFPIICIMINSMRLINSIRLADTVHFGHISIPAVSLRTFSLAHMRVVKSIEVRSAAVVYTMLTDWTAVNLLALGQACRVFELFTNQCVRYRTDHLGQRLAFCVSSARFE